MQKLYVNGKEQEFSESDFPGSISALLAKLNIAEETVVAELDGNIIERKNFSTTKLSHDSKVELIRFVGGG